MSQQQKTVSNRTIVIDQGQNSFPIRITFLIQDKKEYGLVSATCKLDRVNATIRFTFDTIEAAKQAITLWSPLKLECQGNTVIVPVQNLEAIKINPERLLQSMRLDEAQLGTINPFINQINTYISKMNKQAIGGTLYTLSGGSFGKDTVAVEKSLEAQHLREFLLAMEILDYPPEAKNRQLKIFTHAYIKDFWVDDLEFQSLFTQAALIDYKTTNLLNFTLPSTTTGNNTMYKSIQ